MKPLASIVLIIVLSNHVASFVAGDNPLIATPDEREEEYRRLYDEEMEEVKNLIEREFLLPRAQEMRYNALVMYDDAARFAEGGSWRMGYDSLRGAYRLLKEAAQAEESYLKELGFALTVVFPILVIIHAMCVFYIRRRSTER